MSGVIASSLVSATALVIVALLTFALNERAKRAADWRNKKLEYYAGFFDSLAVNLEGYSNEESHRAFARQTNNMNLIASAEVLEALHAYRAHISVRDVERDYTQDNVLLANLVGAMRSDLKMPGGGKLTGDMVRLWTPGTRTNTSTPN